MYPTIYKQIEQYLAEGVPTHLLADRLAKDGWPAQAINDALNARLAMGGRQKKTTLFKDWIKKYYRRSIPAIIVVVIINVISVSINLLKPWPTKILADSAFGNIPAPGPLVEYTGTSTLILITSGMTLFLFVFGTLFGVVRDFILLKIGFWLNRSIKQESMRHIMHLPLFHQERLSKGDYVYRQNVVTNSLSDLVLGTTSSITESIIVIIGVLAIMFSFNVGLTFISIVLIPFLFLTMKIIGPRLGRTAQELTEVASETSSRINESVDNAETVQAFTLENKLLAKITKLWDRGYVLSKRNLLWGELLTGVNGFLIVFATSAVMYLGGSAALRGELTLGELLIFMTYMGYLLGPVESLVEQITSRNQKIIDVNRIYEVLADHEGIEYLRANSDMLPDITGRIEFQNVTYSYNDQPIFENLNMVIPAGEKVAIIGPSGGGKSTILKLLPLFIEPDSGRVLMDNVDIESVSLKQLRQHISWVSQTPQLFEGTIIDNLTDGDPYREISNEEIVNAIETANVTEFAAKMPMGLASLAGENGGSLSGGQRQRISIARALIKNAPIVCLDEPTAALDAKSENLIRDSLMQMIQGKTVLMVTHRRSLLALMDVVYVLDNGTLTDVNELGGLDHYLSELEGIEEQKIEQEIASDQSDVTTDVAAMFQQYMDLYSTSMQVEPEVSEAAIPEPVQPVTPQTQNPVVVAKPWTPPVNDSPKVKETVQSPQNQEDPETEVLLKDMEVKRALNPDGTLKEDLDSDDSQDVTINLH